MRHTAIRISDSYDVPQLRRQSLAQASHLFGAAQVAPDEMGGYFDFIDWRGRYVTRDNFRGRWTLLYFGYSRCKGSCREAAPMITEAAETLRARGLAARAAFVDIETPPVSQPRMISQGARNHDHAVNWPMRFAMARLYEDHGGKMEVLSGTRAHLAKATAAYHVLREHMPPQSHRDGPAINHSSMVYLIGPDTLVAGYGYHDMGAATLADVVEQLDRAERLHIDVEAAKRRYLRGACGGELPVA